MGPEWAGRRKKECADERINEDIWYGKISSDDIIANEDLIVWKDPEVILRFVKFEEVLISVASK